MKTCRLALTLAALTTWMAAPRALADGGQILLHQSSGAFTTTVYASPEPLFTGAADLSVMIQDNSQIILDADVSLLLQPPKGPPVSLHLKPPAVATRLMQSTTFRFDQPGRWALTVIAQRGTDRSVAAAEFVVAESHSRQAVLWFFLLLPPVFIVIFAVHQALKRARPATLKPPP